MISLQEIADNWLFAYFIWVILVNEFFVLLNTENVFVDHKFNSALKSKFEFWKV